MTLVSFTFDTGGAVASWLVGLSPDQAIRDFSKADEAYILLKISCLLFFSELPLGSWHERSRPDRDNYVEIISDNIKDDQKLNFRKYSHGPIDSLGVPYDYGSIMHYGKRDFAKWPWQSTIKSKNGASIGQRKHLSALDVKQMNLFYECNKK
ncbi:zinc metalloproteinase nas-14-like [Orbicella faveolata]|uniref:zinc metalloproteinase nas-14-like n=1 Tax=Orbicella faveolata TaxID=48498 RepID=UPI0009E4C32A|nr:zinc metalloproteinase nas-14-like [Orbicella faveolata]